MSTLFSLYNQFLSLFPDPWHPIVSLAIVLVMLALIFRYWKVGVVGIILLVIFVPASIPVLQNIGKTIIDFISHRP